MPVVVVVTQVYEFLLKTPACNQTKESVSEFAKRCEGFKLTQAEKLNIINWRPSSVPDVYSVFSCLFYSSKMFVGYVFFLLAESSFRISRHDDIVHLCWPIWQISEVEIQIYLNNNDTCFDVLCLQLLDLSLI
jgi:hypothetical protein